MAVIEMNWTDVLSNDDLYTIPSEDREAVLAELNNLADIDYFREDLVDLTDLDHYFLGELA